MSEVFTVCCRRFWLVARREVLPHGHRSIAPALCDPTSNEATSQKRRNPSGRGRFALGLRCSVGRVSPGIHSLPRASPQGKTALCKLCSIPRSGELFRHLVNLWLCLKSRTLPSHSQPAFAEREQLPPGVTQKNRLLQCLAGVLAARSSQIEFRLNYG